MRQSYRLIWNSFAIWILRILRTIPEIILLPFIIHRLGEAQYGIYILGWSLIPVFELLRMGMSSGIVKYSAEYFEKNNIEKINQILSTSCLMCGILGFIAGVGILLATNLNPGLINSVSPENPELLKFTCNAVGIIIIITFPIMPYAGILHSIQRYDLWHFVIVISIYIRLFIIIGWFWIFGKSFEVLIIASALYYIISNYVHVLFAKRLVSGIKFHFNKVNKKSAKILFGFGSVVVLCSLCTVVNTSGVKWITGAMISPAFVAVLAIIYKPASLLKQLVQAMALSIMPAASRYSGKNEIKILKELFIRSTRYITIFLSICMIEILYLMTPVVTLWLGDKYGYLGPLIIVFCGGMAVWMSTAAAEQILRGILMLKETFLTYLVGPVLITVGIIITSIILGYTNYWPIVIAYCIGFFISAAMRIYFCADKFKIKLSYLLWHSYGEPILLLIPVITLFYFAIYYIGIKGLIERQIMAAVSILFFIVLFFIFFTTEKEKQLIKNIRISLFNRLKAISRNFKTIK